MRTWLVLLVLGLTAAYPPAARAKSYALERIAVDAFVIEDGTLQVTERLTYDFTGSFSFAYRVIPRKPGEALSDIRVRESGHDYRRSADRSPGTFTVAEDGGRTKVTWYYRAKNERRTFDLEYTMHGVVHRYPDAVEVYQKFIGEDWDRPIGKVTVTVHTPKGIDPSGIRAWAHGPLHGWVDLAGDGTVTLSVSPLPAGTYWEGRLLLPTEPFDEVPLASRSPRLPTVLAEEAEWAAQANRRREARLRRLEEELARREQQARMARRLLPVAVILGVVGLLVWFQLFRRHGWPHAVVVRTPPGELPSEHRPAVLSYILHRTVLGSAIVATLVDLAERGYLRIEETVEDKKRLFGGTRRVKDYRFDRTERPLDDLDRFERALLEYMLEQGGEPRAFTMSRIKGAARRNRTRFHKWFKEWVKDVKEIGKAMDVFEPYPARAMVLNAVCGVVIAALGFVMMAVTDSAAGLPAVGLGFLQAVLTTTLQRRTPQGRRLFLAWKAFKDHLKSMSRAMGPVSLGTHEWSRYLIAAIVLGVYKKLIPNLRIADGETAAYYPVWYYGLAGEAPGEGLSDLSAGISAMVDSVSTTMSSASGAGGGASAGGGGGSGGGGGGAG